MATLSISYRYLLPAGPSSASQFPCAISGFINLNCSTHEFCGALLHLEFEYPIVQFVFFNSLNYWSSLVPTFGTITAHLIHGQGSLNCSLIFLLCLMSWQQLLPWQSINGYLVFLSVHQLKYCSSGWPHICSTAGLFWFFFFLAAIISKTQSSNWKYTPNEILLWAYLEANLKFLRSSSSTLQPMNTSS